jgi:hypothetical protein
MPKTPKKPAFSPAPRSPATITPIGALWRQRPALANAAALARHAGRTDDEPALRTGHRRRDAWSLRRPG